MSLEIKGLSKEYSLNSRPFLAIDNVSLSVGSGEFTAIVGRSGSGKSTLLNLAAGLLRPSAGSILLDGREYFFDDEDYLAFLRNTKIGYIAQGRSLLPNFSVLENVALPFYLYQREGAAPWEKALSLLEQVGLKELHGAYPAQLSGGEYRRVAIARALINSPTLLLADEPTSDLDAATTGDIMRLFSDIAKNGASILMVTHENDAADYAGRIREISYGRLV